MLLKYTYSWPYSELWNHSSKTDLGLWFCLFVSVIRNPSFLLTKCVFETQYDGAPSQRRFLKEKDQRESENKIPGTSSTITAVPPQTSSLFYKRKLQLKLNIYVCELFGGPNGRFLRFHEECNFLGNSKWHCPMSFDQV